MRIMDQKRLSLVCLQAILLGAGLLLVLAGPAAAKSLYMVPNHMSQSFDAWNINPDGTATYQATYGLTYASDPGGIGIDNDTGVIFISGEWTSGLECFDAVHFVHVVDAPGPTEIAGVTVDSKNDFVYGMARSTNRVYIFKWDPSVPSTTMISTVTLQNCVGGFGIDYDSSRNVLWVADAAAGGTNSYYDVDFYQVDGLGTSPVDIEVFQGTVSDTVLGLFDASGTLIAFDDDGGPGYLSMLTNVTPINGSVRFAVSGYYDYQFIGQHTYQGTYSVAVWPTGTPMPTAPVVTETEPNNTFAQRNVLGSSGQLVIDAQLGPPVVITTPKMVRAYPVDNSLTTWNEDTTLSFSPVHQAVDVKVDRARNLVYTISFIPGVANLPPGTGSPYLSRFDLTTRTETLTDMGHSGVGLAVDEVTGYAYVTGGWQDWADTLSVWDPSTFPATKIQETGDIGDPAGIAIGNISYNPLDLAKIDHYSGSGVGIGTTFTYEITFDNSQNVNPLVNTTLVDDMPDELDFVSATNGGVWDPVTREITWNLGTIPAGAHGPTITVTVLVNANAVQGGTIYNYATLRANGVPPTTVVQDTPVTTVVSMDCFHVYSSEITYGRDEDEDDDTFQATGSFSVGVPAGGAVSFALDGIEILNVQFSDFSDEGADVYDYRSADGMTRIVLNWNDCSWAVSGHGLGLSGVDNSDGVLHQLAFGSLTGEETVSMVATGHGLSYLALDPVNCCDEDEESDETGEAVFMRTRGVGNLILRAR